MDAEMADMVTGELAAAVVEAYIHALPVVQGQIGLELGKMKQPGVSPDERLAAATRIKDMLVMASGGIAVEGKAPQDVRIVETSEGLVAVYINGKLAYEDSLVEADRLIRHLDNVRVHWMEITAREYTCPDFPPQDISEIEDRLEDPEPSEDDDG